MLLMVGLLFTMMLPMMLAKVKANVMIPAMGFVVLAGAAVGWVPDAVVMVLLLVIAAGLAMAGAKWIG